jgi:hypothetical protein
MSVQIHIDYLDEWEYLEGRSTHGYETSEDLWTKYLAARSAFRAASDAITNDLKERGFIRTPNMEPDYDAEH